LPRTRKSRAFRGAKRRVRYAVVGLVAFRLAWGFAGSDSARFANFVNTPISTAVRRTLDDQNANAVCKIGE